MINTRPWNERRSGALRVMQQLQQLDPLDEPTNVTLMRLHALVGDVAGAQKVYEFAVKTLLRELDAEPGTALVEAYARLHQTPGRASADVRNPPDTSRSALVGRHAEWRALEAAWRYAAAAATSASSPRSSSRRRRTVAQGRETLRYGLCVLCLAGRRQGVELA